MRFPISIRTSLSLLLLMSFTEGLFAAEPTGLEMDSPKALTWKWEVGEHALANGVSTNAISAAIDKTMAEAGLRFVPPPHEGRIQINVDTDSEGEFLVVDLKFLREVTYKVGAEERTMMAPTWQRSFNGRINKQSPVAPIIVTQVLTEFVDAHAKMNPHSKIDGSIVAADPKYQFVVVDLGEASGVKAGTGLSVWRGPSLIGQLKIVRVEKDYCVANPIKGSTTDLMVEGDMVRGVR